MSQFLFIIWSLFFCALLSGAKTDYLAKAVILLTALTALYSYLTQRFQLKNTHSILAQDLDQYQSHAPVWNKFTSLAERKINKYSVASFIILTFAAIISAYIFDFEALNGTLWDLTFYIQTVYSKATTGVPEATFPGLVISHDQTHRSLSIPILAILYRIFQTPWVVLIWQGFFLFAPGLVALFWYRDICRQYGSPHIGTYLESRPQQQQKNGSALGYFFVFLCWASSPVVMRLEVWPYTPYILGPTLLCLAYWFYFKKRWLLWFVALAALAYEKEDYGIISSTFGLLVLVEHLLTRSKTTNKARYSGQLITWLLIAQNKWLPITLGIIMTWLGVYSFISFHHSGHASVVPFVSRFGNFGATPKEAIQNFFVRPELIWLALSRGDVLKYVWFFFVITFLWFARSWSAIRYFIPVFPVLFANTLSSYSAMQSLKDYYALPVMTGALAAMILGVFQWALRRYSFQNAHALLAVMALLPYFWGHQSTFRTLKEKIELWHSRDLERKTIAHLRKQKEIIICCDERLCSLFADRPFLIEARHCLAGKPLLSTLKGRQAVYLVYASENYSYSSAKQPHAKLQAGKESLPSEGYVPFPAQWSNETNLLKLSHLIKVQTKTF